MSLELYSGIRSSYFVIEMVGLVKGNFGVTSFGKIYVVSDQDTLVIYMHGIERGKGVRELLLL